MFGRKSNQKLPNGKTTAKSIEICFRVVVKVWDECMPVETPLEINARLEKSKEPSVKYPYQDFIGGLYLFTYMSVKVKR